MSGLDLRPDTTTLDPTRMRRNDIQVVRLWFPPGVDHDSYTCQVRYLPTGVVAVEWTFEVDDDPPEISDELAAEGVDETYTPVLWTLDATDLLGPYRYDVQDEVGNTKWGAAFYVDADVTEAVGS